MKDKHLLSKPSLSGASNLYEADGKTWHYEAFGPYVILVSLGAAAHSPTPLSLREQSAALCAAWNE